MQLGRFPWGSSEIPSKKDTKIAFIENYQMSVGRPSVPFLGFWHLFNGPKIGILLKGKPQGTFSSNFIEVNTFLNRESFFNCF